MSYTQERFDFGYGPAPQAAADLQTLDVYAKLNMLKGGQNFYPTTRRETHEAMTLIDYVERPGAAGRAGTASRLNEIFQHQQKAETNKPEAAVQSVTSEYAAYARKARADGVALRTLFSELVEIRDVNPFHSLASKRKHLHTGVGQLVRQHDLDELAQTQDPSRFPFDPLTGTRASSVKKPAFDPYTAPQPDPEVAERIDIVLGSTRHWQGKELVETGIEEQRHRFGFWVERLQEAQAHAIALPVARKALQNLGILVGH